MTRLDIPTGQPSDAFIDAFERAVPAMDLARNVELVSSGGSWADIEQLAAENAPHGFMLYARVDARPVMAVAGHTTPAIEYLMGNHILAERMFRYHPAALLYAPLRVLVYADDDDDAVLALDQPATAFGSLGHAQIDEVGRELDAKVAALLKRSASRRRTSCRPDASQAPALEQAEHLVAVEPAALHLRDGLLADVLQQVGRQPAMAPAVVVAESRRAGMMARA